MSIVGVGPQGTWEGCCLSQSAESGSVQALHRSLFSAEVQSTKRRTSPEEGWVVCSLIKEQDEYKPNADGSRAQKTLKKAEELNAESARTENGAKWPVTMMNFSGVYLKQVYCHSKQQEIFFFCSLGSQIVKSLNEKHKNFFPRKPFTQSLTRLCCQ